MEEADIRAFGPKKDAALIESSKVFAKDLMKSMVYQLVIIGFSRLQ